MLVPCIIDELLLLGRPKLMISVLLACLPACEAGSLLTMDSGCVRFFFFSSPRSGKRKACVIQVSSLGSPYQEL